MGRGRGTDWHKLQGQTFRLRERELVQASANAMVEMLDRYDWEWYLTLTFRGVPGLGYCYRAWGELMWWLRLNGGSPNYFRATEWQSRGVPHFHSLAYGVDRAAFRSQVVDWWWGHFGIARVESYDARLGAAHYVSEYVLKEAQRRGDWSLEIEGVPRRLCELQKTGARVKVPPVRVRPGATVELGSTALLPFVELFGLVP